MSFAAASVGLLPSSVSLLLGSVLLSAWRAANLDEPARTNGKHKKTRLAERDVF